MCGINGILGSTDASNIERMNEALLHRGPDDGGIFIDAEIKVSLGHRRLSILDLSAAGHQPMAYAGGRFQIVYNGEIYNFRDIRSELISIGHSFHSDSDTEVLLAAYSEWGEECLSKLRGMYAFAIYDRDARKHGKPTLFLARDRLGIKPLYYAKTEDCFVFSSEIKGMLASGKISKKADRIAILHYLSLGAVPQPRTILADVKMLLPGHWLKINENRSIETGKYWDIEKDSRANFPDVDKLSADESYIRLRGLLDEATRLHLISDVPVGAFLSGGIDSTAVVGLMSKASTTPIQTFSLGFGGASGNSDEQKWAELVAKKFGARHSHRVVTDNEVASHFDQIIAALDQPSLDGTNTYLVSKFASASVKVVLSGLGGDELFAGYPHFRELSDTDILARRLHKIGHGSTKWWVKRLPGRFFKNRQLLLQSRPERLESLRNLLGDRATEVVNNAFLGMAEAEPLAHVYKPFLKPELDVTAEVTSAEVGTYLVNTLLRDADAMSMAHSLECRPVLLDHVLAEFAFAMPSHLKFNSTVNKPALVNSLRDILPPEVIDRKKMGFELPLGRWLAGGLRSRAEAAFSSKWARDIFTPEYLELTLAKLRNGDQQSLATWSYFVLLEWLQTNSIE